MLNTNSNFTKLDMFTYQRISSLMKPTMHVYHSQLSIVKMYDTDSVPQTIELCN